MTNGLIVPDEGAELPEGASVQIVLPDDVEFQREMAGWDALGAQAWALIDEWERKGLP